MYAGSPSDKINSFNIWIPSCIVFFGRLSLPVQIVSCYRWLRWKVKRPRWFIYCIWMSIMSMASSVMTCIVPLVGYLDCINSDWNLTNLRLTDLLILSRILQFMCNKMFWSEYRYCIGYRASSAVFSMYIYLSFCLVMYFYHWTCILVFILFSGICLYALCSFHLFPVLWSAYLSASSAFIPSFSCLRSVKWTPHEAFVECFLELMELCSGHVLWSLWLG